MAYVLVQQALNADNQAIFPDGYWMIYVGRYGKHKA